MTISPSPITQKSISLRAKRISLDAVIAPPTIIIALGRVDFTPEELEQIQRAGLLRRRKPRRF